MHEEILMIALILGAAVLGGRLASRVGYPSILGEITVGILLGPPLLGLLNSNEAIDILGEFGILLMMLYIGMHLDLGDLRKASRPGLLAAMGGFIVPTGLGTAAMFWFGRSWLEALFVGLAMGVTSLATKSRILVDLKILDTRIAHVLVAGALLSDVTVLVVFAAIVGPETADGISLATAGWAGVKAVLFGLGAFIVGTRVLPYLNRWRAERELDRGAVFVGVIAFGLLVAYAAELAGLHAILGAFAAGLFIDEGVLDKKTARDVEQKLATMSVAVLAPFFFVSAGFEVSLSVFRTDLVLLATIVGLATLGKVLGTALFYLPSGNGWREGIVVGAGMNGRGAVEIIVAELALAQGLIDVDVFSILVFMALFTTATVPILLTAGVRWLRRRGELVRAGDRHRAIVVGAGAIARQVGLSLSDTMPVTHIDPNHENLAAARREGLDGLAGNGMDQTALEAAGVGSTRLVVAATPNAEVNILTAQLAVDLGVPEVAVLLRHSDASTFDARLRDQGIGAIKAPDDLTTWEHAAQAGTARLERLLPRQVLNGSGNGVWPYFPELFPVLVLAGGQTYPLVDPNELEDTDVVMTMRREAQSPGRSEVAMADLPR